MATTAGVVVVASLVAERAGPFLGGLIATLPVTSGPAYLFLAIDATDAFVAEAALHSFAINPITVAYMMVYARLVLVMGPVASAAVSLAFWFASGFLVERLQPGIGGGLLLHLLVYGCIWLWRPPVDPNQRPPAKVVTVADLLTRALLAGTIVAAVVSLSAVIGSGGTGMMVVFPTSFSAMGLIMHRRHGARAASAVLSGGQIGMLAFSAFTLAIHWLAEPLGDLRAIAVGLGVAALSATMIALIGTGAWRRYRPG